MKDVGWPVWPTATVPLANPGLLIGGRYELRTQIGVGAMGAVWLAHDQRLGRAVALKQVVLEAGLDHRQALEARQRILREGRIAARLQHPHAVSIYDVTTHDDEPWLVMEYVPSRSLAGVLTEDGLLSDREAARIGMQLADALQAAHLAGIVHRDVKPGNILVHANGTAKLVDFGIARAAGDVTVTQTGILTGTPDYFAPELARGGKPTPEADVFALGATLYICVEGEPPFGTSKDALTQMQVVAGGQVRPPRQAGRLTSTLERLLAADPAERPTAGEAAKLLRAVAIGNRSRPTSGASIGPVPVPLPEQARAHRGSTIPPPRSASDTGGVPAPAPAPVAAPVPGREPLPRVGRAAHRLPGRDARRRMALIALAAIAGLALLTVAGLSLLRHSDTTAAAAVPVAAPAAPARTATDGELAATARAYYALLPRERTQAWQELTPRAQAQVGGTAGYAGFWADVQALRVLNATPSGADQSVRVQLRLTTTDGRTESIAQRLQVSAGPDGRWLVDAVDVVATPR